MMDELKILVDQGLENAYKKFKEFADNHGVSFENEEDWYPWWEFWIDGYYEGKVSMLKEEKSGEDDGKYNKK